VRPTREDVQSAVADAHRRWDGLAARPDDADAAWREIAAVAHEISGTTRDAARRSILYFALYEDSGRNLMFPLIAAHGSLWGVHHTERLDRLLTPLLRVSRRGRVRRWLEGLDDVRDVNRRVFREIYTTFYFTRFYGRHPRATVHVRPPIVERYNRVHDAVRTGVPLTKEERRDAYFEVFVHEQNDIVDPGLADAARLAGSPLLEAALKRVSPRFKYFPRRERLWFTDFTDVEQRNREGLRALDFAEEVGPDRVFEALGEYV
jgi:hypothetical protein